MKLLSISTDRKVFEEGSAVRARLLSYAACFSEVHVIVFAKKSAGFRKIQLGENVWVYPTNSWSKFGYMRDARLLAKDIACDVVTTQDPFETGLVGKSVAKKKGVPLHVQVHTEFLSPWFKKDSLLNRVRVWIAKGVIAAASQIRVVSSRMKTLLEKEYAPKADISVLPIYVDIKRYKTGVHSRHPWKQLLFVGRLEKEKRPEYALSALSYLRERNIDARLTLVGEGSLRNTLVEKAKNLGVADRVDFVGYQHPMPYYQKADLLLVPSAYEGYGMVIIEAIAAGVPVVATDVGIAKESGAYIAPHTATGFAKKVVEVINNKASAPVLTYPYENEAMYIAKWCEDIEKAV